VLSTPLKDLLPSPTMADSPPGNSFKLASLLPWGGHKDSKPDVSSLICSHGRLLVPLCFESWMLGQFLI